jgi:uncharacterized membrane protein (UPF0127 family)
MNRRHLLAGLTAVIALAAARPAVAVDATRAQPELRREKLVIITHDGVRHDFNVEVATTLDQQEVGLMWRTSVPADGGMLFDWGVPRESQMWMRNTITSLDMLFIDQAGVIRHIVEDTTPRSLAVIDGTVPVRATLELAAGTAERLDIRVGDHVEQRIFSAGGATPVAAATASP